MSIIKMSWWLTEKVVPTAITRYCKNCGRTVEFKDSLIRRHNSNGKNIFRFAIYKCEKDHTWNRKLSLYKAYTEHAVVKEEKPYIEENKIEIMDLDSLCSEEVNQVNITIENSVGDVRLDKLLAERLMGWSRSQIVRKIKEGLIQVNHKDCKPSQKIGTKDLIVIMIT
ncbi:S4 domain-containing protein [Heyndrickxia sporothermodurans]